MSEIKTEYRGIVIGFDEHNEEWSCELADKTWRKTLLADVKKKIDAFYKAENSFTKIPSIWFGRERYSGGKFGSVVSITSLAADGDVWIFADGKRSKVRENQRNYLCADTPANRAIIEKIIAMDGEIEDIEAQIREASASAERVFKD